MRPESALDVLRAEIRRIEGKDRRITSVLPFGLSELDSRLPGGGLALGALHEVAGGGNGAIDGAAAALFSAGIAARTKGKVLWCITRPDLFAPAIEQAGLVPDRVIYLEGETTRPSSPAWRKDCAMVVWAQWWLRWRGYAILTTGATADVKPFHHRRMAALRQDHAFATQPLNEKPT